RVQLPFLFRGFGPGRPGASEVERNRSQGQTGRRGPLLFRLLLFFPRQTRRLSFGRFGRTLYRTFVLPRRRHPHPRGFLGRPLHRTGHIPAPQQHPSAHGAASKIVRQRQGYPIARDFAVTLAEGCADNEANRLEGVAARTVTSWSRSPYLPVLSGAAPYRAPFPLLPRWAELRTRAARLRLRPRRRVSATRWRL